MCRDCVTRYVLDLSDDDEVTEQQWQSIEWPVLTSEQIQLSDAVERLYGFEGCSVGGPLHIVTDDYNLEDDSLDFCEQGLERHWSVVEASELEQAKITATAKWIIALMRPMNLRDRAIALGHADGYVPAGAQ